MSVYQIETTGGTYQIETEDAPQQAQSFNPADIKGNLKQDTLAAAPILPAAGALGSAVLGGAQWLSNKLSSHGPALPQNAPPTNKPKIPYSLKDDKLAAGPVLPASLLGIKGPGATGGGLLDTSAPNAAEANPANYDRNPLRRIPSFDRAGRNFEAVQNAAQNAPVDVSKAGDIALRIQEMAGRGGSQPKVVRDFVARATSPGAKPLTYSELRDFASNASRLSADEAGRLTPAMKREMGAFAQALNSANEGAAEAAGVGDKYRAAMSEYKNAAHVKGFVQGVKDAAKSQVVKTVGGGLLGVEALKKMGLL